MRDKGRDLFGGIHTLREWESKESMNQRKNSHRGRKISEKTQDDEKQVRRELLKPRALLIKRCPKANKGGDGEKPASLRQSSR